MAGSHFRAPILMPTDLTVLAPYGRRGWRLKIRDKERVEPPHVSLLYKTRCWRFGLREQAFLDDEPPQRDVPKEVFDDLVARTKEFAAAWDLIYPGNPVTSELLDADD